MKIEQTALIPPDYKQCQAEKPNGVSFMSLGGVPRLERCKNTPIVIATERKTINKDGQRGSMSLCAECMNKATEQLGDDFATFKAIDQQKES